MFSGGTESIRVVQFSPHQTNRFASADDAGTLKLWDLRYYDRYQRRLTAHTGPIYGIDYHAEKAWIATAGRDKLIKVIILR